MKQYSKEEIYSLIGAIQSIDDRFAKEKETLLADFDAMLTDLINPPVEKTRKPRNTSGVVQCDIHTGAVIATYKTIKEANIAIGKPEKATGIGDALNGRTRTRHAYGFAWKYGDEM